MATVRIYRDEADGELFPQMCVRCGAEAEGTRQRNFAWHPGWVNILLIKPLLWLIVVMVIRKTMRVTLPICERHRNHWLTPQLYVWLGLLWWFGYAVALAFFADGLDQDAATAAVAFLIFGGLFWLVGGLILVNRTIRAGEITDEWIELVHVHRDFRDAWKEIQPQPVPVVRRPRRRRPPREEYDDYEDDR